MSREPNRRINHHGKDTTDTSVRIVMPRTKTHVTAALPTQGNIAAYEIDDIDRLTDLLLGILQTGKRHGGVDPSIKLPETVTAESAGGPSPSL